jgi:hypothetical protein
VHGRIERADGIAELNVILRDLFERCTMDADGDAIYMEFSLGAGHLAGLHAAFDEPIAELTPPWRLDGTADKIRAVLDALPPLPYDGDPEDLIEGAPWDNEHGRTEPLTFV